MSWIISQWNRKHAEQMDVMRSHLAILENKVDAVHAKVDLLLEEIGLNNESAKNTNAGKTTADSDRSITAETDS